ncbi:hypothetical protein HGRIS_006370 [Hohenbuehelia grisea]|uniref:G-patch domain-containing protein n=1 Tax=Hohenbuehelia grisea TaxID=104357 RepID=A0ABR3K0Y0_9AGAR
MATVSHTIYSHYNAEDREVLEILTGQAQEDIQDEVDQAWQAESSLSAQRRMRAAPSFVPATQEYDPWSLGARGLGKGKKKEGEDDAGRSVAEWYRSVRRDGDGKVDEQERTSSVSSVSSKFLEDERTTPASSCPPETSSSSSSRSMSAPRERRNKHNWFIMNAISSTPATPPAAPPSLADILQREPPPSANEPKFRPPAWVAIGPSNKGYTMLQQSGWNEGEPLGPDVVRQRRTVENIIRANGDFLASAARAANSSRHRKKAGQAHGTSSGPKHPTDVIDLTLSSDSESEGDMGDAEAEAQPQDSAVKHEPLDNASSDAIGPHIATTASHATPAIDDEAGSHRTALLTPIATVLKADRLGIGLKAKTTGPHRASKKRITHNAAALAAHMRAAEEMRRRQREFGRGRRGFDRANKREAESRQHMLAYLNS